MTAQYTYSPSSEMPLTNSQSAAYPINRVTNSSDPPKSLEGLLPNFSNPEHTKELQEMYRNINQFLDATIAKEWDRDVLQANVAQKAEKWIYQMFTRNKDCWKMPHISISFDQEVVFEWMKENKLLVIYVSKEEVIYSFSWGYHILQDMEDGALTKLEDFRKIWLRLIEG